ncbi:MAG: hypothetical protein ACI9V1_002218 [Spirosomataceae bacterium]|jgi:hypothetical protein
MGDVLEVLFIVSVFLNIIAIFFVHQHINREVNIVGTDPCGVKRQKAKFQDHFEACIVFNVSVKNRFPLTGISNNDKWRAIVGYFNPVSFGIKQVKFGFVIVL